MIRTKIVATMGPAVAQVGTLLELFRSGVDVCRLNFSHGSLDEHLLMLRKIREAAAMHDQPVAILGDLSGPKIRLGKVKDIGGTGGMAIEPGDQLILPRATIEGENGVVSSTFPQLIDDVQVGQRVLWRSKGEGPLSPPGYSLNGFVWVQGNRVFWSA